MITLYHGNTIYTISPADNSEVAKDIMGDNTLTLQFELVEYQEFPIGTYCTHDGERYTLWQPPQVKKIHDRRFSYTMPMQAEGYIARTRLMRNVVINYDTVYGRPCTYELLCKPGVQGEYIKLTYGQTTIKFEFKDTPQIGTTDIAAGSLTDLAYQMTHYSTLLQTFTATSQIDQIANAVTIRLTGVAAGELTLVTEIGNDLAPQLSANLCQIIYEDRGADAAGRMAVNGDYRVSFPLTATAKEHLQMCIDALNYQDVMAGETSNLWSIGDCLYWEYDDDLEAWVDKGIGKEQCVTYDYVYISDALNLIAEAFDTEWEITNRTISLHKVEYNKSNPLTMSYGFGNGFASGGTRANAEGFPTLEMVCVQGSEQNIDPTKYGPCTVQLYNQPARSAHWGNKSRTLLLPFLAKIWYDGDTDTFYKYGSASVVPPATARLYAVTPDRQSVYRLNSTTELPILNTYTEQALDATEIYPKRVGTVTRVDTPNVTEVDVLPETGSQGVVYLCDDTYYVWELDDTSAQYEWHKLTVDRAPLYDIYDHTTTCPDYSECSIKGETMTIIFQSGMLAGKEFDLKTLTDGTVRNPYVTGRGRKFEIVPKEIDGQVMPSPVGGFYPKIGDTYAIFHCTLPNEYFRHDSDLTGAEWEMFKLAVQYLYQHEDARYTFTGSVDKVWLEQTPAAVPYMSLGQHIYFQDDFLSDGLLLRVTGMQRNVNNPYDVKLTISNALVLTGMSTTIIKNRGGRLRDITRPIDINRQQYEAAYIEPVIS